MATNYQRGRDFEYRTRKKLLDRGAVYVMRAAQSKGKVDLMALFGWDAVYCHTDDRGEPLRIPDVWAVQCKRDGRLPAVEREALLQLYQESGAIPILAKAGPNGRGVEFIDLREES